jgi:outer membrane receptor protein involved in Fe transport
VNTVFHLNYGSFMQRPSFQYVVSSQVLQGTTHSNPQQLGNPRLEPEVTNSYDVGVMQGLLEGFTLDVSGYYKDVKNLIDQATYTSVSTNATYTTWFNRDYADIRGFRVALTKRKGAFTGSINYQFGVATGKSATTSSAPVTFTQDTSGAIAANSSKVPIRDILLNFDRTHNLIVNLAYTTSSDWGPRLWGGWPLADITLSTNSFFRSGRPYTSPSNPTNVNGARTPGEYNTDLRVTKRIGNFFGVPAMVYLEVLNLFNQKILNYDYIFSTPDAGSVNNIVGQYEKYGINDPVNGIRYYADPTQTTRPNWARVDQSFLIYDNQPRSYTFGLVIEL